MEEDIKVEEEESSKIIDDSNGDNDGKAAMDDDEENAERRENLNEDVEKQGDGSMMAVDDKEPSSEEYINRPDAIENENVSEVNGDEVHNDEEEGSEDEDNEDGSTSKVDNAMETITNDSNINDNAELSSKRASIPNWAEYILLNKENQEHSCIICKSTISFSSQMEIESNNNDSSSNSNNNNNNSLGEDSSKSNSDIGFVRVLDFNMHESCLLKQISSNMIREIPSMTVSERVSQACLNENFVFIRSQQQFSNDVPLSEQISEKISKSPLTVQFDYQHQRYIPELLSALSQKSNLKEKSTLASSLTHHVPARLFIKFLKKNTINGKISLDETTTAAGDDKPKENDRESANSSQINAVAENGLSNIGTFKGKAHTDFRSAEFAKIFSRFLNTLPHIDPSENTLQSLNTNTKQIKLNAPPLNCYQSIYIEGPGYWDSPEQLGLSRYSYLCESSSSKIWCAISPSDIIKVKELLSLDPSDNRSYPLDLGWCFDNQIPIYIGLQKPGDTILFSPKMWHWSRSGIVPSVSYSIEWLSLPKYSIEAWKEALHAETSYFNQLLPQHNTDINGENDNSASDDQISIAKQRNFERPRYPSFPILNMACNLLQELHNQSNSENGNENENLNHLKKAIAIELKKAVDIEHEIEKISPSQVFSDPTNSFIKEPRESDVKYCESCYREIFLSYFYCTECAGIRLSGAINSSSAKLPQPGNVNAGGSQSEMDSVTDTQTNSQTSDEMYVSTQGQNEKQESGIGSPEISPIDTSSGNYSDQKSKNAKQETKSSSYDSSGKRDRSRLPSTFRTGSRVIINGIGKTGIIKKTANGYLYVEVEGTKEVLLKRRQQLEALTPEAEAAILNGEYLDMSDPSGNVKNNSFLGSQAQDQTKKTPTLASPYDSQKSKKPSVFCYQCALSHPHRNTASMHGIVKLNFLAVEKIIKDSELDNNTNINASSINSNDNSSSDANGSTNSNAQSSDADASSTLHVSDLGFVRPILSHLFSAVELLSPFVQSIMKRISLISSGDKNKKRPRLMSNPRLDLVPITSAKKPTVPDGSKFLISAQQQLSLNASPSPPLNPSTKPSNASINAIRSWKLGYLQDLINTMKDNKVPMVTNKIPVSVASIDLDTDLFPVGSASQVSKTSLVSQLPTPTKQSSSIPTRRSSSNQPITPISNHPKPNQDSSDTGSGDHNRESASDTSHLSQWKSQFIG